jgi:glycosyltransferase involved in cell wall biosynthesis
MPVTLVRYSGRVLRSPLHARGFRGAFERPAAAGWRSYLVCAPPPVDPGWLTPLEEVNTTVVYMERPRRKLCWRTIRRTEDLCRRVRADVFHCDNIHLSPLIGAWLARVPVRLWFKRSMERFYEELREPDMRDWLAPSVRLSCWLATSVVSVSSAVRDQLIELRMPREKLLVLDNPIMPRTIDASMRARMRGVFGFAEDDVVILTVGRAAPVKGWDVLVDAFHRVAMAEPRARLLLVGGTSGPDEQAVAGKITRFVERHGLRDRVVFAGRWQDVSGALAAGDIFAMPSHSEGNSNALNEAFGAGLACVATRVGNAPNLIRDGESGILVPRNEPASLAQALLAAVRDPGLRARLAKGAGETVLAPSLDQHFERAFAIYTGGRAGA